MTRPRAYFKVKDRRQARKPNPPTFSASPIRRAPARAPRPWSFWLVSGAIGTAVLWLYAQSIFTLSAVIAALMAAALLELAISFFEKREWTRFTGLVLVFLFAASILFAVIQVLVPALARETELLTALFASPRSEQTGARAVAGLGKIFPWLQKPAFEQSLLTDYASLKQAIEQDVLDFIAALFTSWLTWAVLAVLIFILLAEGRALRRALVKTVPNRQLEKTVWLVHAIPARLEKFLRIQALLVVVIAVVMALAFYLMRLPGFLILGMLAGYCSLTPYFGSVLGALITLIISVFAAGTYSLTVPVLVAFGTMDLLKNIVLSMRAGKAGAVLGPLETVIAMLAGGGLAGLWGILLAAPMMAMIKIVLRAALQARRDFHATR